jgi:serine/threonine protein kinase
MISDVLCGHCFQLGAPGLVCRHCGRPLAGSRDGNSLPVGTVLDGKFVLGDVLGSPGGFGIVYLAWDRVLQRKLVIKELFPDGLVARMPGAEAVEVPDHAQRGYFNVQRELFLDEARKLARLEGVDAVARVTHYFAQNDTAYLVMPFVPGVNLERRVADAGRLPLEPVLHWLWPLARGLQAVHESGLVHRDIKPENVLIDERGRPVLIDFGNAMAMGAGSGGPAFSAVSRHFAAPEQYANDPARVGTWTDIYAFGALLYYCLSGRRPTDAAARSMGAELPPLAQLAPGLPPLLRQAIEQAMALDPRQRQASVADLLAQLEPLRPRDFHWVQALPVNGLGERMLRVHKQVLEGRALPRGRNLWAGLLQGFWLFPRRLLWPAVTVSLFMLAAVGLGLWLDALVWTLPLAWALAALPCAIYADAWHL